MERIHRIDPPFYYERGDFGFGVLGVVKPSFGYGYSGALTSAELYNPVTGVWTPTGSLKTARYAHTANLLPNGVVLVTGGYISGYLATEAASATHAWVEVFIPGTGWRALDPTHNRQIDGTYVKIGHGRDYADVPPVSGNYRGTLERTMQVQVQISAVQ